MILLVPFRFAQKSIENLKSKSYILFDNLTIYYLTI